MNSRLTIKDIARLSGVSKSTVSRVLNNDQNVNPQTRASVMQVINTHNFIPSKSARAMRSSSDKVIAVIVTRLDSPSENKSVRTMLPVLYEHGFDVIVLESQFSISRLNEHFQMLKQRNVDGVIVYGFNGLEVDTLMQWGNKLVLVARDIPGISSVTYDDSGAVRILMHHLLDKKIDSVGFLGVYSEDVTTGMKRSQAYEKFCHDYGLCPYVELGEMSYESGYRLTQTLMKNNIQSIVCATDTIALGANKFLQERCLDHISVCSIGNLPLLQFLFPETISIDLGYGKAGSTAANQLMDQLEGRDDGRSIVVSARLEYPR